MTITREAKRFDCVGASRHCGGMGARCGHALLRLGLFSSLQDFGFPLFFQHPRVALRAGVVNPTAVETRTRTND